jgi:predicted lactoylglutathione lyase
MKMNYFVFGTNDMDAAVAFYDALFADDGPARLHSGGRMTLWGGDDFMFALAEPFDAEPATRGNGTMLGLNVKSSDAVESLYRRALELGGTSEGEPGVRSGRFSAYIRDLDGNKICLFV